MKPIALSVGTEAQVVLVGVRASDLVGGGKEGVAFMFASAPAVHALSFDSPKAGAGRVVRWAS